LVMIRPQFHLSLKIKCPHLVRFHGRDVGGSVILILMAPDMMIHNSVYFISSILIKILSSNTFLISGLLREHHRRLFLINKDE